MRDVSLPNGSVLPLADRVLVMGIVNVTPDSFSDGGRFFDASSAIDHGLELVEQGADILDIGAESTRPGASPVSASEEERRLLPVVGVLAEKAGVPLSVDTTKMSVARSALDAGATIVNDVTSGGDPEMFALVAERKAPIILMHMRGEPRTMQAAVSYRDVVAEVKGYLAQRAEAAREAGIQDVLIDPGFGFGKLREHNLVLLRRLHEFVALGYPVVSGTSRKSFIGATLGDLPVEERSEGTAATVALSVVHGASVVRVHDVRAMRRVIDMVSAVMNAKEPGEQ